MGRLWASLAAFSLCFTGSFSAVSLLEPEKLVSGGFKYP